jgi:hypothetical protein
VPELVPPGHERPLVPELVPPGTKWLMVPEPAHEIDEWAGSLPPDPPGVSRRAREPRPNARTWERPMRVLEGDLAHGFAVYLRRVMWMRDPAPRPYPCRKPVVSYWQAETEPRLGAWMCASSEPSESRPANEARYVCRPTEFGPRRNLLNHRQDQEYRQNDLKQSCARARSLAPHRSWCDPKNESVSLRSTSATDRVALNSRHGGLARALRYDRPEQPRLNRLR